uniref:Uncharacterized protein n=1 Tax=Steinernema glaseri TaxID=37863 RepID=A0A1I8AG34_9BILA
MYGKCIEDVSSESSKPNGPDLRGGSHSTNQIPSCPSSVFLLSFRASNRRRPSRDHFASFCSPLRSARRLPREEQRRRFLSVYNRPGSRIPRVRRIHASPCRSRGGNEAEEAIDAALEEEQDD